ncbi:MAG: tetratricopeptide repeat protein [Alphaproteobacteria bacterium]|nr:tetratricopeptide repeat protein [Alphaproteobacteria bacterium]
MRVFLAFALALLSVAAAPAKKPPSAHKPPPLDQLFAKLKQVDSAEDARPIEEQIEALFAQSGSPSVDLLMARGSAALEGGDGDAAKKLFDAITDIAPDFAEAWHQKALMQQDAGDDEGAMISLQKTVTLNPRQFSAMSELGDMLEGYGNKAGALALYRRALALDPQLEGAAKHLRALEKDVEGQGI